MLHTKFTLIILIFVCLGPTDLQAQNMYVKENAGTQTAYSLNNIRKLSFSSGKLTISKTDNSYDIYTLDSLRLLSFSDSTSVHIDTENIANQDIRIYPNPVHNKLKIDLTAAAHSNGIVNILSLEGKVLKSQEISGTDIISIDMSHLPSGTYICHFRNETEIKSMKIIKQ